MEDSIPASKRFVKFVRSVKFVRFVKAVRFVKFVRFCKFCKLCKGCKVCKVSDLKFQKGFFSSWECIRKYAYECGRKAYLIAYSATVETTRNNKVIFFGDRTLICGST